MKKCCYFPSELPILILRPCLTSSLDMFRCVSFHIHIASIIGFMFLAHKLWHVEIIPCFGGSRVPSMFPSYAAVFTCGIHGLPD